MAEQVQVPPTEVAEAVTSRTDAEIHAEGMQRFREDMRRFRVANPLPTAAKIALQSLRIRFGRSIITIGGIFFAIAFLVSVITSSVVEQATAPPEESYHLTGVGVRVLFDLLAKEPRQAWLVTMSLLVAMIGIANAMLMSVTERYKEIGTMKCLGALDMFVVELFLLESGFQGLVGSFTGALLGALLVLASAFAKHGMALGALVPWAQVGLNIVLGTIAGVLLTLIGSSFPAYRASQMPPAEAMRTEV